MNDAGLCYGNNLSLKHIIFTNNNNSSTSGVQTQTATHFNIENLPSVLDHMKCN